MQRNGGEGSMFDLIWETYPTDLCVRKGSKKEAKKSYDKIINGLDDEKAEEMGNKIITGIREWIRHDRGEKKRGEFVPRWPMVTTFLNQERWSLEDIPQSDSKQPTYERKCECGEPTEILNQCWSCREQKHPPDYSLQKTRLRDIGLTIQQGESRQDYNRRCKDYCTQKTYMGSLIGRGTTRTSDAT